MSVETLRGLHGQVLDGVGRSLAGGEIVRGRCCVWRTSRSDTGCPGPSREAVRVLESKRVVTSRPRAGVIVRPMSAWNLYDPQVIRWRPASPGREAQLRELAELRAAVEPAAAALTASRHDPRVRDELTTHARAMDTAAREGDGQAYVTADAAFHRVLLTESGSGMFAQLAEVTEVLLEARRELLLLPVRLETTAIGLRHEFAEAVVAGRAAGAAQAAAAILGRARAEVEQILADSREHVTEVPR